MVSQGRGHPSSLSRWRREFESRWDRNQVSSKFLLIRVVSSLVTARRSQVSSSSRVGQGATFGMWRSQVRVLLTRQKRKSYVDNAEMFTIAQEAINHLFLFIERGLGWTIGRAAQMADGHGTVNPAHKKRRGFESLLSHIWLRSSEAEQGAVNAWVGIS